MLATLLESAVIATMITAIVVYMNFQKESQLKYITQERKEWRDIFRRIAKQLHGANINDTSKLLTELKVRINTEGYKLAKEMEVEKVCEEQRKKLNRDCLKDSHIWYLIFEIEELSSKGCKCYSESLTSKQEKMIDYISLLLKDDWERAKEEASGIKKFFRYPGIFAVVTLPSIVIIYGCYYIFKNYFMGGFDAEGFIFLMYIVLLLLLICFYTFDGLCHEVRKVRYKRNLDLIDARYDNSINDDE